MFLNSTSSFQNSSVFACDEEYSMRRDILNMELYCIFLYQYKGETEREREIELELICRHAFNN